MTSIAHTENNVSYSFTLNEDENSIIATATHNIECWEWKSVITNENISIGDVDGYDNHLDVFTLYDFLSAWKNNESKNFQPIFPDCHKNKAIFVQFVLSDDNENKCINYIDIQPVNIDDVTLVSRRISRCEGVISSVDKKVERNAEYYQQCQKSHSIIVAERVNQIENTCNDIQKTQYEVEKGLESNDSRIDTVEDKISNVHNDVTIINKSLGALDTNVKKVCKDVYKLENEHNDLADKFDRSLEEMCTFDEVLSSHQKRLEYADKTFLEIKKDSDSYKEYVRNAFNTSDKIFNEMIDTIANQNQNLVRTEKDITSLKDTIQDTRTELICVNSFQDEQSNKIQNITRDIQSIKKNITDTRYEVSSVRSSQADESKKINRISNEMKNIHDDQNKISSSYQNICGELENIKESIGDHEVKIVSIDTYLDDIQKNKITSDDLKRLEESLRHETERITGKMQADLDRSIKEELYCTNDRISHLENAVENLKETTVSNIVRVNQTDSIDRNLAEEIETISSDVDDAFTDIATLTNELKVIDKKVDSRFSANDKKVDVRFNTTDKKISALEKKLDILAEENNELRNIVKNFLKSNKKVNKNKKSDKNKIDQEYFVHKNYPVSSKAPTVEPTITVKTQVAKSIPIPPPLPHSTKKTNVKNPKWIPKSRPAVITSTILTPIKEKFEDIRKPVETVKPIITTMIPPTGKPIITSIVKPIVEPIVKPIVKSIVEPIVKPIAEPTTIGISSFDINHMKCLKMLEDFDKLFK